MDTVNERDRRKLGSTMGFLINYQNNGFVHPKGIHLFHIHLFCIFVFFLFFIFFVFFSKKLIHFKTATLVT
jgi:hypothetical protein